MVVQVTTVAAQGAASTGAKGVPALVKDTSGNLALPNLDGAGLLKVIDVGASRGTTVSDDSTAGMYVRPVPSDVDRISFAKVIAGGVDAEWGTLRKTGPGQSVNQAGGNLAITTGTTVNSDTIIRSNASYVGGVRLRGKVTLSQRIANQAFFVELVDVLGDALAVTISSATVADVTFGSIPSALSVGQSMFLGGYTGTGTFVPGRYVVASIAGNVVTFTVAGFAAGSGTCSAFGWNYYHLLYDGTTATSVKWDTQRRGWALGDTAVTINTTTSGHLFVVTGNDLQASVADMATNGWGLALRGSKTENVPDDVPLQLQIRAVNGAAAPATSTTFTLGFIAVGNFAALDTVIQDQRQTTAVSPSFVQFASAQAVSGSVTVSGTATATPATPTTPTTLTTASTNATAVKASAGTLYGMVISNPTATAAYLRLYNKASAPAPATDSALVMATVLIPASSTVNPDLGALGLRFSTGIAFTVTGGIADTDATNTVAGIRVLSSYV